MVEEIAEVAEGLRVAPGALEEPGPKAVQAETSGHNKDSYPQWSLITYEFPENDWRPGLKMYWYDGGKRADPELIDAEFTEEKSDS